METKPSAILIVVICTIFSSSGSFFQKKGMDHFRPDFYSIITNYDLILGIFLIGIGAVLLIWALKNGELSVIHPILGLTYVWALFLAYRFLGEKISYLQITGVVLILCGLAAIGRGAGIVTKRKIRLRGSA